jgi:hypothetical protein
VRTRAVILFVVREQRCAFVMVLLLNTSSFTFTAQRFSLTSVSCPPPPLSLQISSAVSFHRLPCFYFFFCAPVRSSSSKNI